MNIIINNFVYHIIDTNIIQYKISHHIIYHIIYPIMHLLTSGFPIEAPPQLETLRGGVGPEKRIVS